MAGRILWILIFYCGVNVTLGAQIPSGAGRPTGFGGAPGNNPLDSVQQDVELDTFKIFYASPLAFYREQVFSDSLLTSYTHQLDPTRRRRLDYQHLGILGSAAQPFVFQLNFRQGFDLGLHQFDVYRLDIDQMPYYRIERAFTYVEYDRGGDQADSRIQVKFSRNFARGVNLGIDYERLTQLASRIQFPNQRTQATAFGLGISLQNENGRYQAYLTFVNNKNIQEENGGMLREPTLGGSFAAPAEALVQTETAFTEYRNSAWQFTHYFNLRKPEVPVEAPAPRRSPLPPLPDSTDVRFDSLVQVRDSILALISRPAPAPAPPTGFFQLQEFFLGHSLTFDQNSYKFFETSPLSNLDYYEPFLTDIRGLRYFVQHRELRNRFFLLTYRPAPVDFQSPRQSRGLLQLGIDHRLHFLQQEPEVFTVHNLFLTGKWHYLPTDFLRLETYGHLGLLDNIGDFRAEGKLELQLGRLGLLSGSFTNQLAEPGLVYRRWLLSQQPLYENAFGKILESRLEATYALPQHHFSVTGAYHLVDNQVYFDTLGQARQAASTLSVWQLIVAKDFALGAFHLDNQLVFQRSSEDFVRLPALFGKHSLFYLDDWFREALRVRIGLDLRYTSAYHSMTYSPVIGNFHLQDEQLLPLLPLLDAYMSIRVSKFKAYAKIENLRYLWVRQPTDADGNVLDLSDSANWRLYYPTAFYPLPNATGFRFGIRWRFLD